MIRYRAVWFSVSAAILCVALYYPGLNGAFMFDDSHTVEKNPWIQVDDLGFEALRNAAESFSSGGRELAMLSFALNHYLFGHDAFAYKAVNLGIHVATGLLLYLLTLLLVSRLVAVPDLRENPVLRWSPELVAGIWMVSPINLTSVLYISQRMTSLSALFVIAGLYLYASARARYLDSGGRSWLAYPAIVACLLAAWHSKENGLLLVPLLFLVEFVVFGFRNRAGKVNWHVLSIVAALLLGSALFVAVYLNFNITGFLDGYDYRSFSLEERLLTQARLLVFYFGLVLFPLAGRFGLWHDDIEISSTLLSPPDTLTSIVLLLLLCSLAVAVRRRYPLCTLGILWYFIGHSMESSVLPLEMVHEHRNYLPAYGVLLALVGFLGYLGRPRWPWKALLLGSLAIVSSWNLYVRAVAWSGEYRHALHEFTNHPLSSRATFEMAAVSLKLAYRGVDDAEKVGFNLLEHARELGDETILPEAAMILASGILGREVDPEWVNRAAARLRDTGATSSDVLALRGLRECIEGGECRIRRETVRPLYDAATETRLGLAIDEGARYFDFIGEKRKALKALGRAAKYSGRHVEIRLNYIWSLIENGMLAEAREQIGVIEKRGFELKLHNLQRLREAEGRLRESGVSSG
ncbi:MAG: hypothetical protein DWQ08_13510 [Proteobacteria bacterium]|nr:MAG: hypothetical protein DWQ08_13510 [Pseudomonadota bacterium]